MGKSIRKILAALRKADQDYNLIEDDDKILVGVSGGKDSPDFYTFGEKKW